MKYPRGIGFDPVNRRVWVANNAAGTVYVYDDNADFLFQVGSEDNRRNSEPGMFEKPFGIAFGNGYAYVTDVGSTYDGNTVQVKILDALTGAQVGTITGRNAKSVAVDEATGEVYVADANAGQQKIYVYGPTGGTPRRSFGGKGTTAGTFTGLWGVTVSNGVVYATDSSRSRVQAFTTSGTFLGAWGGAGTGPFQFRNPSGISHDAQGRIYVADASNDRISVFDPATARPAYAFSRPALSVSDPPSGSTTDAPLVVRGTATDDRGLAGVEISVRDEATGLWWEPGTATWTATQTWGSAPWHGEPTTAQWSWTFPGPQYGRAYQIRARARDVDNTVSAPVASVVVRVERPDPVPPDTTLEAPVAGSTADVGTVGLAGRASDDRAVASVQWSVQHDASGRWWNGVAWVGEQVWLPATPTTTGATDTGWSASWTPPAANDYRFEARSVDSSGNADPSPAATTLTLAIPGGDVSPPNATVAAVLASASLTLRGRATDDTGIRAVDVAVQDTTTGLWWDGSTGTWGRFTWMDGEAAPEARFASPTAWSTVLDRPAPGTYRIGARARDVGGLVDPSPAWTTVQVG